jgi:hypothetical protein
MQENSKSETRNNTKIQNSNEQNGCFNLGIFWIIKIRYSKLSQSLPWNRRKIEEIPKCKLNRGQNMIPPQFMF